ncbi:hypothetical protein HAX54_028978 [Datura stramonium]|uniref:Uncharacterized protein n=1 Tax=Datura stramonium TaxID=4076 RepID=A0ABS8V798_DATST|nr:hypothetical protein [Datura stramonium]
MAADALHYDWGHFAYPHPAKAKAGGEDAHFIGPGESLHENKSRGSSTACVIALTDESLCRSSAGDSPTSLAEVFKVKVAPGDAGLGPQMTAQDCSIGTTKEALDPTKRLSLMQPKRLDLSTMGENLMT